jgi:hypothetical protein
MSSVRVSCNLASLAPLARFEEWSETADAGSMIRCQF